MPHSPDDIQYALETTEVLHEPDRRIDTFGDTRFEFRMISELMDLSLLDVFKAHQVHGTKLARKSSISYAIQLARGMNYLHNW